MDAYVDWGPAYPGEGDFGEFDLGYFGTIDSSGNFDINDGSGGSEIRGTWSPSSITGTLTAQGGTDISWWFNVGRVSNPRTSGPNRPAARTALVLELGVPSLGPRRE